VIIEDDSRSQSQLTKCEERRTNCVELDVEDWDKNLGGLDFAKVGVEIELNTDED